MRDSDIVGRFGGDEFLLILIDANLDGGKVVSERLLGALHEGADPFRPRGIPPLQATMGLASLEPGDAPPMELGTPDFPSAVERLVEAADAAMYRAQRDALRLLLGPALNWADFLRD